MDFLKINNEFQNLQKKLEESEKYIKNINNCIKKTDKEIIKLEQKIELNKDIISKTIDILLLEVKKEFKDMLNDIINKN